MGVKTCQHPLGHVSVASVPMVAKPQGAARGREDCQHPLGRVSVASVRMVAKPQGAVSSASGTAALRQEDKLLLAE